MAAKSLADRVAALEAKVGSQSIEQQFREQAELIDRRFSDAFREQAALIDRRFSVAFREQAELIDRLFIYRFDEFDKKFEVKLEPIRSDLAVIKNVLKVILERLP